MNRADLENHCDAWLHAWTGNEPNKLLAHYAPNAYYEDPARPTGLHGHTALKPYFTKLLAAYPTWTWRRKTLHPIPGGYCVTHEATIPLAGQPNLNERCIDIVLLNDDGLITHNEVYFDRTRWLAALQNAQP